MPGLQSDDWPQCWFALGSCYETSSLAEGAGYSHVRRMPVPLNLNRCNLIKFAFFSFSLPPAGKNRCQKIKFFGDAEMFIFCSRHRSSSTINSISMKDYIIPVDFSETSLNAARYAANMLSGKANTRVILYHMFKDEDESATAGQYLDSLKAELEDKGVSSIETIKELGADLIDNLGRLAYQKTAELIIMGISEKDEWRQLFIGSNTVKMAEENICPVMIIPSSAKFNGISNIALTSDFKDVENTTPELAIKTVLEVFNARLHIVNVDNEHYVSLTQEYLTERGKMQKMFADFNPEFYFIGMNDFYDAIEQFAKDKNIDLIIVIPKNHTFINSIFSRSHTKKLAFNSSVPILAAHQ